MKSKIYNVAFFVIVIVIVGIAVIISMHSKNSQQKDLIVGVHVKGAVNNPGYYELEYNSRIKDAIEIAGGAKEDADSEQINLAQKLRDGEEIIMPYKEPEVVDDETSESKTEDVSETKSVTASETKSKASSSESGGDKVNINTADLDELCSLSGIGEATADKIIEYRDNNGKFNSIDELKNIKGIGNSKFDDIKDEITV